MRLNNPNVLIVAYFFRWLAIPGRKQKNEGKKRRLLLVLALLLLLLLTNKQKNRTIAASIAYY